MYHGGGAGGFGTNVGAPGLDFETWETKPAGGTSPG